jgi:hypothetical protein
MNAHGSSSILDSMTPTVNSFECDYLRSLTSPISPIFPSEQTEFVHVNERISLLSGHISQLNTWRRALHDNLRQPHDPSSMSHTYAIDASSYILQPVINPMESTAHTFECDYLRYNPLPIPSLPSNEHAELAHANKESTSLDSHISQLDMLQQALQHRANQLHNRLSPINALPVEILSYVFERVNDSNVFAYPELHDFQRCIRRAFVLGSVTTHFRRVAHGTPELWTRVPLNLRKPDLQDISRASALLQHCITLAPIINISVYQYHSLHEYKARTIIGVLLTPEAARKIKALMLSGPACAPHLWVEKLKGSFVPMLDTLSIRNDGSFDLGTLKTVTRLKISDYCRGPSRILPPSLRYLHVDHVSERELISLLTQCPNLVECFALPIHSTFNNPTENSQFNEPLTLSRLERLTFYAPDMIALPSSAENFRLPSLEFLNVEAPQKEVFSGMIAFCGNLSTTLTTLIISVGWGSFDSDDIYQVCKLPFPQLKKLKFVCTHLELFWTVTRTLARVDGECCNPDTCNFPALKSIVLVYAGGDASPSSILDLLMEWRIGEAFCYHLVFKYSRRYCYPTRRGLSSWRSYLGSRKIEITWNNCKVLEHPAQDNSL